jgi:hypothetical protein
MHRSHIKSMNWFVEGSSESHLAESLPDLVVPKSAGADLTTNLIHYTIQPDLIRPWNSISPNLRTVLSSSHGTSRIAVSWNFLQSISYARATPSHQDNSFG